ncbi:MAG TPA: toll/interleukin-1 receptor domain-containing protein [Acidimicrobiales bacterium]|nr:toll/interleukin-1 receptor domain-containing protein [Acidimicrobiales bacterium]
MSYSPTEWRTFEPVVRVAEVQARTYPDRRDLFLCHAWDDRQGAAKDLYDELVASGATVWFSETEVGLGKSLLREIDRGLAMSRIGIVLVTPALLKSLEAQGVADQELSALLFTDRVIPVAHGTTFDALRAVSPLLAARSGLTIGDGLSMQDAAKKVAAAAAAESGD